MRGSQPLSLLVKLAERPRTEGGNESSEAVERSPSGLQKAALGLMVREIDAEFGERVKLPASMRGVVVSRVEPMSPAFDAQIQQGQVLLEINRQPVRSVRDYQRLIDSAASGDALTFYLYQPDRLQHVLQTLTID